jgi:DNA-binding response OmpR family regulator
MVARVLVIDDDEPIRVLFATALERRGYEVGTAPSGDGGVEAAMKMIPELVLLDLEMPGMDGWQTLSALRAQPLLAAVPVVLITACELDAEAVVRAGFDHYLRKPVTIGGLTAAVERFLSHPHGGTGPAQSAAGRRADSTTC